MSGIGNGIELINKNYNNYENDDYVFLDFQEVHEIRNRKRMISARQMFEAIEKEYLSEETDVYNKYYLEDGRNNDEISIEEEGFMSGYLAED